VNSLRELIATMDRRGRSPKKVAASTS